MSWYPSANTWYQYPDHQMKYQWDQYNGYTEMLIARAGLTAKEADKAHVHIFKLDQPQQECNYKDSNGRYHNIGDYEIQQILKGANPLL